MKIEILHLSGAFKIEIHGVATVSFYSFFVFHLQNLLKAKELRLGVQHEPTAKLLGISVGVSHSIAEILTKSFPSFQRFNHFDTRHSFMWNLIKISVGGKLITFA